MSNMSYCRFQNTLGDFRDCQEVLDELIDGGVEPLSKDELVAAKALARKACEMVERLAEAANVDVDVRELIKKLPGTLDSLNASAEEGERDQ